MTANGPGGRRKGSEPEGKSAKDYRRSATFHGDTSQRKGKTSSGEPATAAVAFSKASRSGGTTPRMSDWVYRSRWRLRRWLMAQ